MKIERYMGNDVAAGRPASQVADAYVEAVEGRQNGRVLAAREFKK